VECREEQQIRKQLANTEHKQFDAQTGSTGSHDPKQFQTALKCLHKNVT
jgi:hypothetical protein